MSDWFYFTQPELLHDYGDLRHSTSLTAPAGFATDYVIDFDGPSKLMLGSNSYAHSFLPPLISPLMFRR